MNKSRKNLLFLSYQLLRTLNNTYLVIKYIVKFCITQNTPTQKSATAKFAKKKFVMDLSLLDNVTTNITRRFPEMKRKKKQVKT